MDSQLPPDDNRVLDTEALWWTEISIAFVFILLRFWARIHKRTLGLDDAFMVGTWLCYLGAGIVVQVKAQTGGTRHFVYLSSEQKEYETMLVYLTLIIGIACTGLGKIAIGITILRILGNTSRWERRSVWLTIIVTTVTSVLDIVLTLFRCGNPRAIWTLSLALTAQCLDKVAIDDFNVFCAAWQAFADFFFSLLPMYMVWGLRMQLRRKMFLMVALGLTLFTGIAGAVKTALAVSLDQSDITWNTFGIFAWFGTEAMLIIVCGSVPTLHPLWERYVKQPRQGYGPHGSGYDMQRYGNRFQRKSKVSSTLPSQDVPSLATYTDPMPQSDVELAHLTGNQRQLPPTATAGPQEPVDWSDGADDGRIYIKRQVHVVSDRPRSRVSEV